MIASTSSLWYKNFPQQCSRFSLLQFGDSRDWAYLSKHFSVCWLKLSRYNLLVERWAMVLSRRMGHTSTESMNLSKWSLKQSHPLLKWKKTVAAQTISTATKQQHNQVKKTWVKRISIWRQNEKQKLGRQWNLRKLNHQQLKRLCRRRKRSANRK